MKHFRDLKPGNKFIFANDVDQKSSVYGTFKIPVYIMGDRFFTDTANGAICASDVFREQNQVVWVLNL
jgi:hypothetical protein